MNAKLSLLALIAVVFVAGCSTSSAQYVAQPNLRVKSVPTDMARIVVFRAEQGYGSGKQLWVADGTDLVIGELGTDAYLTWERPAGPLQIRFLQEAGASPRGAKQGSSSFPDIAGGRTYYFEVDMPAPSRHPRAKLVEYTQVADYLLRNLKPAPVTGPPEK